MDYLDIALDYGFQTHAGFTKAFVKVYGLPPERYRIHAIDHLPERVELTRFLQYQFQGGIIMEPKILERPAFTIAGMPWKPQRKMARTSRISPSSGKNT